jgi:hypothetical protein
MLLDNFARTVLAHTSQQVTAEQKQAAFPGLVRLFKDFLLDRPEFNVSNQTFQDASRDREFNARLRHYFQQQVGYEALVAIHQKPQSQAFMERLVSPDKTKELLVDEETIQDYSTRFVASIAAQAQVLARIPFTDTRKKEMVERVTSAVSQYILDHPEYNSYRGFEKLRVSDECKNILLDTIMEFMEGEGMFTEE